LSLSAPNLGAALNVTSAVAPLQKFTLAMPRDGQHFSRA
jgi:hypothetical protein